MVGLALITQTNMISEIATWTLIKHWILAIFGAIVNALSVHRKGESKSFLDFIILTIMSSFTWVMFTLLALHFVPASPYLALAASWAWGYIGIEWMSMVTQIIKSKFWANANK